MTFSMVIWGLWSQDCLYPFLKSLGRSKGQGSLGFALSWVSSETLSRNILWDSVLLSGVGWKDRKLHWATLVSFSLCPSIQLQTRTQVWVQERFAWSRYGVFCYLYLALFLYQEERSSNKQQWFFKWIHSYNATISIKKRWDMPISPEKFPVSLCSQTTTPTQAR